MSNTSTLQDENMAQALQHSRANRIRTYRRTTLVFLFIVALYFANQMVTPSKDTFSNSILPFSLLLHHDVFLGRYLTNVDLSTAYYASPFHGDYISSYPIGPAVTALPIYFVYLLFGGHASLYTGVIVGKFAAAIIAATSVLLFYRLLQNLGLKKFSRVFFTVVYAFGSQTFSIGSQALWQHGPAELWIVVFLLGAERIIRGHSQSLFPSYASGFALGMLLLSRPQDMVIAIPFFLLLIFSSKRKYVLHALPLFLLFALFNLLYNTHFYAEPTLRGGPAQIAGILSAPFSVGLAGNLISPSRGIFIFMPWAALSFFWIGKVLKKDFYQTLYAPTLIAAVLYILLYSKLGYWAAGFSFGPRYMTDISPVLALLAAGYWDQWKKSKSWLAYLRASTIGILAVWSVLIQLLGTYVHGFGWNLAALPDTFASPLWSVRNGEISYYLRTLEAEISPAPTLQHPSVKFLSVLLLDKPNIYSEGVTPSVYQANTVYSGVAVMENTGNEAWSVYPAQGDKHSVFFNYSVWSGDTKIASETGLGALLHSVKPGQKITVYFYFTTPKIPGSYTYLLTLTQGENLFETQLNPHNAYLENIVVR